MAASVGSETNPPPFLQSANEATPEFLEFIGIEPTKFIAWRNIFTICDGAYADIDCWMGILRKYMEDYLWALRKPDMPEEDPDVDRDAAVWMFENETGLTRKAANEIIDHLLDVSGTFALQHFLPAQLARPYIENRLWKYYGKKYFDEFVALD